MTHNAFLTLQCVPHNYCEQFPGKNCQPDSITKIKGSQGILDEILSNFWKKDKCCSILKKYQRLNMLPKIAALRGLRYLGKHILEDSRITRNWTFIEKIKMDIFCFFINRPKNMPIFRLPKRFNILRKNIFFIEFKKNCRTHSTFKF